MEQTIRKIESAENREQIIQKVQQMTKRMRKKLIDMSLAAGASSSHFGGGLSTIEIVATLYGAVMKYDAANPEWKERDRFILSKGHGCLGYYTALSESGFIPEADLLTFEKTGSYLHGHPVMIREKGIEFSNGSLGMGLGLGIGVALAARKRKSPTKVYVLMGDGECNEGSVWEAAIAAPHFKLDNIVAIVDRNKFQQTGSNSQIMCMGDMAAKWASFGWNVVEIDGHNIGEIYDALGRQLPEKPTAIVAHTVKGKGFSFSENNNDWHHKILTQAQYDVALEELNKS
jgi:transketolase